MDLCGSGLALLLNLWILYSWVLSDRSLLFKA